MAKGQPSILGFCQSTHKRQRESEEKADDDQDQEPESEDKSEHSCHDPSHTISTLNPQNFGDHSAPA